MSEDVMTPEGALRIAGSFLRGDRIRFTQEPEGLDGLWNSLMTHQE